MLNYKHSFNHLYIKQIAVILSMIKLINSAPKIKQQMKSLIEEINKILGTEHTIFYIFKEEQNEIWARYIADGELKQIQKRAVWGVAEYVVRSGRVVRVDDLKSFPYLTKEISQIEGKKIKSFLMVPIVNKENQVLGCVEAANKDRGVFSEEDISYLVMIASLIPSLFQKRAVQDEKPALPIHKDDMSRSKRIQKQLLPSKPPQIAGYQIYAHNKPSEFIGGDYYDFFPFQRSLSLTVADICGKGVPAALLMANLHAFLHAFVSEYETVRDTVIKTNNHFCAYTSAEMFATFFWADLNHETHQLKYINAGHIPPVLIREGSVQNTFKSGGIPLGMIDSYEYKESEQKFLPGDVMILVSDGILDAMNEQKELFGRKRLENICLKYHHLDAEELGNVILKHVRKFSGKKQYSDDQTIMIIKRTEE